MSRLGEWQGRVVHRRHLHARHRQHHMHWHGMAAFDGIHGLSTLLDRDLELSILNTELADVALIDGFDQLLYLFVFHFLKN